MNQEENKQNQPQEDDATDLSEAANPNEIENLPTESIGSYGRLEELMTDDDADSSDSRRPTD